MSLITKPFTISIKGKALAQARCKGKVVAALRDLKRQYQREVDAWVDVFAPRDTGDLKSNLKQSTRYGFVRDTSLIVGIVLELQSGMEYSEIVNELGPPINWTNPLTEYHFFDVLVTELNMISIPRMLALSLKNQGL